MTAESGWMGALIDEGQLQDNEIEYLIGLSQDRSSYSSQYLAKNLLLEPKLEIQAMTTLRMLSLAPHRQHVKVWDRTIHH